MQIVKAKHLGYCAGVKRAMEIAQNALKTHGAPIYTLGALIHNRAVVTELEKQGIHAVNTPNEVPNRAICVIRTHGVGKAVLADLQARDVTVLDATCPSVKRIQDSVAQKEREGYHVLVVGKPSHPEVRGICGWGEHVRAGLDFPAGLEERAGIKWYVVAQTTIAPEELSEIYKKIEIFSKKHSQTLEFFNSICYTTIERVEECRKIAAKCDAVLVIGDCESNNTRGLSELAARTCENVHFISNVSDLRSVAGKQYQTLGILAGASTPNGLIMEVINRMEQENKLDGVTEDVVTPVEEAPKANESEPVTMEDALKTFRIRTPREGMKLKAKIISLDENGVSVAIEGLGKNDSGFIAADQMEYDGTYNKDNYHVDDVLDVMIVPKSDPKSKSLNLSKRAYDKIKIEDEAVKRILEGEEFRLVCSQVVKGGLLGKLGSYAIFVPASQIRMGYVKSLEEYTTKTLRLKMLPDKEEEVVENAAPAEEGAEAAATAAPKRKHNPKRIVASQRVILEAEKQEREDAFWEAMQINNIIKGKVKRFTPFGAFVSVMGVDCLAHISDLSWVRIKDPSEVLELNKSYEFVVLKADRDNGKVSLGYKQLQKRPYEIAAEKYHEGDVVKGKVERIKDFGAFVSIEPGIDGLIHVSQVSLNRVENISDVLKVGDEVEAKITKFEDERITLSIRQLLQDREAAENAEAMDEVRAKKNLEKFNKRVEAADSGEHKERRARGGKERDDEQREYVSKSSGATMASLFKNLDMSQFADDTKPKGDEE